MEKRTEELDFSISEETNTLLNALNALINAGNLFADAMFKIYGDRIDDTLEEYHKVENPLIDFVLNHLSCTIRDKMEIVNGSNVI